MAVLRLCAQPRYCSGLVLLLVTLLASVALTVGKFRGVCPSACVCQGRSVSCSFRGLNSVPRAIPTETERLDLSGNNISLIRQTDFSGLRRLRILQLQDNKIESIEKGAFHDLTSIERLRLNNNRLRSIPDFLFASMSRLHRLDFSYNKLTQISKRTLSGANKMRNLQIDNNNLRCVADGALRDLPEMETLTLNKNQLTRLPPNVFDDMHHLKMLRLYGNDWRCDCLAQPLVTWLARFPLLAQTARCHSPRSVRNRLIAELQPEMKACTASESPPVWHADCAVSQRCPDKCTCSETSVMCDLRALSEIPEHIPATATKLVLSMNHITHVPARAFASLKKLRTLDLSDNKISHLHSESFAGLSNLNSLSLYGNQLSELPKGVFEGLGSLQLLLLNSNKIKCIRQDAFKDLSKLNLLSLFENQIQSLSNGTFTPLRLIQTLHLARNPYICDCNLRWLPEYLSRHPVEASEARCAAPLRMLRKKLATAKSSRFRCRGAEELRTERAGECVIDRACPQQCACDGRRVDCSGRKLTEIPSELPMFTEELILSDNEITVIGKDEGFKQLKHLEKLDLQNNRIEKIEDQAFFGMYSLKDIQLTKNRLTHLTGGMFNGLKKLQTLTLWNNQVKCISNKTFVDLPSLTGLSLYNNQIQCIQPGSFTKLKSLNTLNLLSNPFNCNCHLRWLPTWLRLRLRAVGADALVMGEPRCKTPRHLAGSSLLQAQPKEFVCQSENAVGCGQQVTEACCGEIIPFLESRSCDSKAHCPKHCKCRGTKVSCRHGNRTSLPPDIPLDTTELYMDSNEITEIPESIKKLRKLIRIDLSHNKIEFLTDASFANLSSLHTLILSHNKLRCLQEKAFAGLPSLKLLVLYANNLSSLPYGTFDGLKSLSHLSIGSNPFYCDCNLKWLSDMVKDKFIETGVAACHGPPAMQNEIILTSSSENFKCLDTPAPAVLAKCDVCYTKPCTHGGTCTRLGLDRFRCACTPGYHGDRCEHVIDACYGGPCEHGGTCSIKEHGRFSCTCVPGFEGDRCETNINDCVRHVCQHNATCVDGVQSYSCACTRAYTGEFCEERIDFCSHKFQPCDNGAKCIDLGDDYRCECPRGYTGRNCSADIDDCQGHSCQNKGKCIDQLNGYTCLCPKKYSGAFCQHGPVMDRPMPRSSVCQNHNCKNKGVCFQPDTSLPDYVCKCSPGFDGKRCEKLTSLSFRDSRSFVSLRQLQVRPSVNITLVFSTLEKSGVILYQGRQQHLAVELFRGRLRISYDVGNYPVSTMYSYNEVSDGKMHTAEFFIIKQNVSLRVDGGILQSVSNRGLLQYLNADDSLLYVGGVSRLVAEQASRNFHIRDDKSFSGCIKKLYVNDQLQDFKAPGSVQYKVRPSCPATERPEPCQSHMCKYGRCRAAADGRSYKCECKPGYHGRYCDKEPTCRGVMYRERYTDPATGCSSRNRVKMRRCQGGCGDIYCCKPKKMKIKKVKMYCPGNQRPHIKDLKVTRKCTCTADCS